jgi:hypothetical protein
VCESSVELPELREADGAHVAFGIETRDLRGEAPDVWDSSVSDMHGDEWIAFAEHHGAQWFRVLEKNLFRTVEGTDGPGAITVSPGALTPAVTVRHFLLDEVVPAVLAWSGCSVLHGAGVVVNGQAIVILGASGMGKSTLAVTFGKRGHSLLTDDCVVIDRAEPGYLVQPSYPSVRVWSEEAGHLLGTEAVGRPFAHYSDKRRYEDGLTFARDAVPLAGIIRLETAPRSSPDHVELRSVRGHDAIGAVVGGVKSMPAGSRKVAALDALIELAQSVRVARLTVPDDLSQLPALCDAITQWAAPH